MPGLLFNGKELCYVPWPKDLLKNLRQMKITGVEHRILDHLAIQTFGWTLETGERKLEDRIALSQWAEGTGMDIGTIRKGLVGLEKKGVITKRHTYPTTWAWNESVFESVPRGTPLEDVPRRTGVPGGTQDMSQKGHIDPPKGVPAGTPQKKRIKERKKSLKQKRKEPTELEAYAYTFINEWNILSPEPESIDNGKLVGMTMGVIRKEGYAALLSAAADFWFVVNSPIHHQFKPRTLAAFLGHEFYREFLPGFRPRETKLMEPGKNGRLIRPQVKSGRIV